MSELTTKQTRKDIETHIIAQAWKNDVYKQQLLNNPKEVFEQEFGVQLPAEMGVQVLEENANTLYFVLPMRPDLSGMELSDEQLEAVAGGTTPACIAASATAFIGGAALGVIKKDFFS